MLPVMEVHITLPKVWSSSTRFSVKHSRWVKESLKEELILHWRRRIPDHFKSSARTKYGYGRRGHKYKARKLRVYKSRRDLVKTGGTETKFRSYYDRIRSGGTIKSGVVHATLILKWPFPVGRVSGSNQKITVPDMAREIETVTDAEAKQIFEGFKRRYLKKFQRGLTERVRRKITVTF